MLKVVWVEIPVKDLDRALKFYNTVFGLTASEVADDGVRRTVVLAYEHGTDKPGISLNQTANFEPSDHGVYVYLDCGEDLVAPMGRVEAAGGKVLTEKTYMEDAGYYASVLDSEGNLIGLYSAE
ncbi:MAG TPA: VOC family protein [Aggregatilinea sp.]|jgi:predicted enzyme related to lactoylglutathione lyase|uniref:VOC family protein n=1 Tax=Aggregatilinea sp. TaxID=2806333 RepID=UPI002BC221E3|nr:VOC family protein [Aggregatilinea sp.]HML21724.1 VOC family protein [Aggregatilinea sp.]